ncbi:ribosome recycling factor [Xylariaceae sp. FL0594]|nr:ribosome recycling factor [Xylariaceae sp. FL0594]
MRGATAPALFRQCASQAQPRIARLGVIYDVTTLASFPLPARTGWSSLAPNATTSTLTRRSFHTSPLVHKKKDKEQKQAARHESAGRAAAAAKASARGDPGDGDDGGKHPHPNPEDPCQFADVKSRLEKHAEYFKAALKKLHTGGRFDPEAIGSLKVLVDKKEGTVYPLHELAQVVPRGGRAVSLLVHDADWVKPIMSAVQASPDYNQQPQRDPDNELELTLKVEPEKREDIAKRVKAVAHEWRERVRAVRQKRDKLHVTWRKEGLVGPDLKVTADKQLEKVIETATAEIDEAEKQALKAVERL